VPDTIEGLNAYFEEQQAKKRAAGSAVLARGSTFGSSRRSSPPAGSRAQRTILFPPEHGDRRRHGVDCAAGDRPRRADQRVLAAGQVPIEAHNMAENDEH
jgi:hypothetical protein